LLARENALRLFMSDRHSTSAQCGANYRRFLSWRLRMDAWLDGSAATFHAPNRPSTNLGDRYWEDWFAPQPSPNGPATGRLARADLRDIALATLRGLAPDLPLDDLRSGSNGKQLVRVRRRFILNALGAGYTGTRIASFLNVSPSTVSSNRAA